MGNARTSLLSRGAFTTLKKLDSVLDEFYGAPEGDLENKTDPLEEAVYIILSLQTNLYRSKAVWKKLRATYPNWHSLARARHRSIARVLNEGGLHEQKARNIKNLLKAVKEHAGSYTLDSLLEMDGEEAERFLTRLPGLSWKSARCVLLYSLGRDAFPIDVNTIRILKRVGIIPSDSPYRRRSLHDGLQQAVPPKRRRRFHVNLVVHGQNTCQPRRPHCLVCPARGFCAQVGVVPVVN